MTSRRSVRGSLLIGSVSDGTDELFMTEADYAGFDLRFEYRWTEMSGDAGIFLFLGERSNRGVEIQLSGDLSRPTHFPKSRHGSLLGFQLPFQTAVKTNSGWNEFRPISRNPKVRVEENGQVINIFDFSPGIERSGFRIKHPGLFESRGRLALQCKTGSIEFRILKIRDRADTSLNLVFNSPRVASIR